MNSKAMDKFYKVKDIAKILGVNSITVRRWIISSKLRAYDLGKGYRISIKDFTKFMDERRVKK